MKLSDEGLRLIKSFEGYHTRLADGSCASYLCPAGVATIGWGCTSGVHLGMVWTEAEAEAALRNEIARFEDGVTRLVTVPLNQHEFDALVSFSYNVGLGAFEKSTLLKRLNAGDRLGAAKAFEAWRRGGGKVLPGLVARRKREAALFLKPTEAPREPYMPQEVAEVKEVSKTTVGVGGAAAGGVAAGGIVSIPTPPDLTPLTGWQAVGETVSSSGAWMTANPGIAAAIMVWFAFLMFLPKIAERFKWQAS